MGKDNNSTADALTERGEWVRFGWFPVRMRPLTLAQIWEIGEEVSKCGQLDLDGRFNAVEEMLSRHADIRRMQRVVVVALFRSRAARALFGWWVHRTTTMERYERVINFCARSFSAPFFFQSMTFLRGAKDVTMNTRGVQARGGL